MMKRIYCAGSHPGLNQGPLTSAVSAVPPELWPPGDTVHVHAYEVESMYMYMKVPIQYIDNDTAILQLKCMVLEMYR